MEHKEVQQKNSMTVRVLMAAKCNDYVAFLVEYSEDDWTSEPSVVFSHTKTSDVQLAFKAIEDHITFVGSTKLVTFHGGFRHAFLEMEAQLQAVARSIDYESCYYNLMAHYKASGNISQKQACALIAPKGVMTKLRELITKLKPRWGKPKTFQPPGEPSDAT